MIGDYLRQRSAISILAATARVVVIAPRSARSDPLVERPFGYVGVGRLCVRREDDVVRTGLGEDPEVRCADATGVVVSHVPHEVGEARDGRQRLAVEARVLDRAPGGATVRVRAEGDA